MVAKEDNNSDEASPSPIIYQSCYSNPQKNGVVKESNEIVEFGACRSLTPLRNRQVERQIQFKRTSAIEGIPEPV